MKNDSTTKFIFKWRGLNMKVMTSNKKFLMRYMGPALLIICSLSGVSLVLNAIAHLIYGF